MTDRTARRDCEHYRALASVGLDGGLSVFAQQRIARHRRRCPDCDAVIGGMADVTRRVREAALEPAPAPAVVAAPRAQRARWLPRPVAAAGFAVVLAVAAGLGVVASSPAQPEHQRTHQRPLVVAQREVPNLLSELPQLRMRSSRLPGGRAPAAASHIT
jgi:predicted anti-sigma-YlaC factor YlaD